MTERIRIRGGNILNGSVVTGGMKNAALGMLFATILIDGDCTIENLPPISDVENALAILKAMGADIERIKDTSVKINTANVVQGTAPFDLAKNMRASYYVLGAELGRFGKAIAECPGGCDLVIRQIDQHIKGFEALNAEVTQTNDVVDVEAKEGGLTGGSIFMDQVSVGATMNIMLAAVKASGVTVIDNAAREPHIVDLANFLNSCGAKITGAGTDMIKIKGVDKLTGVTYATIPDMIEAGTFMVAAAAVKGSKVIIKNVIPKHLESITAKLIEMGAEVTELDDAVIVSRNGDLQKISVRTTPYPGFPTDMNPQIGVLLSLAKGTSTLHEGVWDSRFRYVEELSRMGAKIEVNGKTAKFTGVDKLKGASVRAVDLRAGAAVIIAGLAAEGTTTVDDIYHIERGYEHIVEKLQSLGADITRISIPDISGN